MLAVTTAYGFLTVEAVSEREVDFELKGHYKSKPIKFFGRFSRMDEKWSIEGRGILIYTKRSVKKGADFDEIRKEALRALHEWIQNHPTNLVQAGYNKRVRELQDATNDLWIASQNQKNAKQALEEYERANRSHSIETLQFSR